MILDEYLVALGFKIDEEAWKRWQDRVAKAGAGAAHLGLEVTGAAAAVAVAIDRIAKQYDNLYFASQRVRSSVADIRGFEYAGKSVGVTYDEARGSIEAFAAATRMNPGLQALLKNMGVDPNDSAKASTALIGKLKAQFGEGGYFIAARVAGMYGIDEKVFKQLWTNYDAVIKQQAEFQRRAKESGVDMDDLAKKSRNWTQATDNLLLSLGLMTDQVAAKWLPAMTSGVDWLDKMSQGINKVGVNTNGWSSSILAVVAAIGAAKAAALGLALIPGMGGLAAALGAPAGWAGFAARRITGPLGILLGSTRTANEGEIDLEKIKDPAERDRAIARMRADRPSRDQSRDKVIDYFVKQGWSREQAAGLAANFFAESKFDPGAVGDGGKAYGIAQWHPDRQANFKKLYGKDIRGSTLEEQLAFAQWELTNTEKAAGDALRQTRSAVGAGAVVSRAYERPQNVMSEAASRGLLAQQFSAGPLASAGGGAAVTISQKTDISISGVSNPAEAAAKVADSQDRVNGDLVRNTKGAVR